MRLRERIANGIVWTAAQAGRRVSPRTWPYRWAGRVIQALGGRLESRIISFAVANATEDEQAAEFVRRIQVALEQAGVTPRVSERSLSREQVERDADAGALARENAGGMNLYEIFVPTRDYWKAGQIVESIVAPRNS
jgi:hypothetical protein